RTRWEYSSGSLDHFFDDELVPASKGVPAPLLGKIEPFPTTTDLKPYDPGFLSGWVVEQYQIDLSPPPKTPAEKWTRNSSNCAASKCPATPIAPCKSCRTTTGRPTSTSSCPSGSSPTPTERRPIKW